MEDGLTARQQLERRFRWGRDQRGAAFVLRGAGSTGEVGWIVLALAPVAAWRVVHFTVPDPTDPTDTPGHTALGPLLEQLAGVAPEASDALEGLRRPLTVDAARPRWPDEIVQVLTQQLASSPPLLIAVDGAHRLDAAALDALAATSRRADPSALAVAFGVPARVDPRIKAFGFPLIETATLRAPALVELVQRRLGKRLVVGVAATVLRHVDDDPSAAIEVVDQLDDAQLAGWTALPLPLPGVATHAVPLDTLPPSAREALLLAALAHTDDLQVLGHAFQLADLPTGALDPAQHAGIVRVEGGTVTFPRSLDRSATVAVAAPTERRHAHAWLARAVAEHAPHDLDAHVHHLAASGTAQTDALLPLLHQLATQEAEAGRPLAAARAWAEAATHLAAPSRRAEALGQAAVLARAAGVAAWGVQLVTSGGGASRQLPSTVDGPLSVVHQLTTAGADLAAQGPAPAARLYATAAVTALLAGDIPTAEQAARDGVALASPGTTAAAWAGTAQCVVEALTAPGVDIAARLERHLDAFPSPQEDPDGAMLRTCGHIARVWSGQVDEARVDLRRLTAELDAAGHTGHLPWTLACLAAAEHRRGWWDAAVGHADRARELAALTDQPLIGGYATIVLATIAAGRGQRERCRQLCDEVTAIATAAGTEPMLQYVAAAEGLLELGLGSAEVAASRLEAADEEAWRSGVRASTVLGCVGDLFLAYVENGQRQRAAALLRRLEAESEQARTPWLGAMVLRGEALLGRPEDTIANLAGSSRLFGIALAPFEQARDRLLAADHHLRHGETAAARSAAHLARMTFASLRATPWLTRAERTLEAADRTGGATRLGQLTPQERRVLERVADGATNRNVATALVLSPKTVEYHLHNIYQKLGITSRGELIRLTVEAAAALESSTHPPPD